MAALTKQEWQDKSGYKAPTKMPALYGSGEQNATQAYKDQQTTKAYNEYKKNYELYAASSAQGAQDQLDQIKKDYIDALQSGDQGGRVEASEKKVKVEPTTGLSNLGAQTAGQQHSTRDTVLGNIQDPTIPDAAKQTYEALSKDQKQFTDPTKSGLTVDEHVAERARYQGHIREAAITDPAQAAQYQATKAAQATPVMNAAQSAVDRLVDPITGQVSQEAIAQAAQSQLPPEATMGGQMDELLSGLETGEIPDWAAPAVEQVEAMLAQRGMSRSTIGKQAMFNAIIQAAAPIAQMDAQLQSRAFELNLNNRQQAAMQNAAMYANMDTANLSAAMTAQVENAKNFMSMNMQNLSNEQQAAMVNQQSRMQTLLGDQAADNAAKQFNAANQTQVDTFMADLGARVSQFNATQVNAARQFNKQQQNAMTQFNEQVEFQREQFNATAYNQIEQSNVQWRRQMNQIDTAGQNAVNQANAINAFNLSNQALTLAWQDIRDSMSWAFQSGENDQERNTRMAIAALSNENDKQKLKQDALEAVGGWIATVLD